MRYGRGDLPQGFFEVAKSFLLCFLAGIKSRKGCICAQLSEERRLVGGMKEV